jgi:hypothetical protein
VEAMTLEADRIGWAPWRERRADTPIPANRRQTRVVQVFTSLFRRHSATAAQ